MIMHGSSAVLLCAGGLGDASSSRRGRSLSVTTIRFRSGTPSTAAIRSAPSASVTTIRAPLSARR